VGPYRSGPARSESYSDGRVPARRDHDPAASRPGGTGSPHFAGTVAGLGAGEARRRRLTEADVVAIVRREAAEREAAAREYDRGGRAGEAARLREGARVLMGVLEQGA
jgi:Yqey-like protein